MCHIWKQQDKALSEVQGMNNSAKAVFSIALMIIITITLYMGKLFNIYQMLSYTL
jgi:hypothetical protein